MKLLLVILTFLTTNLFARDYYVSDEAFANDANTGLSPAAPWKTVTKVNGFTFAAGDIINFRCGSRWYASLVPPRSNLQFRSYGTGPRPNINGWKVLTAWTSLGAGQWYCPVQGLKNYEMLLQMGGVNQRQATFPKLSNGWSGYVAYTSVDSNTINCPALGNMLGKRIGVRMNQWRIIIATVISQTGSTMDYKAIQYFGQGQAATFDPNTTNNYGCFRINDSTDATTVGEWAASSTGITINTGSTPPSALGIRIGFIDTLVNTRNLNNLVFDNLELEGGGIWGVVGLIQNNIVIRNCSIHDIGGQAINFYNTRALTIENNIVKNILSTGISVNNPGADSVYIRRNIVDSCGLFKGQGSMNQNDYDGITAKVRFYSFIEYNRVSDVGIDCIRALGGTMTIRRNVLKRACKTAQDHGHFYSYASSYTNQVIEENIISESNGASDGTTSGVKRCTGIYLDQDSYNFNVRNNILFDFPMRGINISGGINVQITGNFIYPGSASAYQSASAISLYKRVNDTVQNVTVKNNTVWLSAATQSSIYYTNNGLKGQTPFQMIASSGVIDSNRFNFPLSTTFRLETYTSPGNGYALSQNTLGAWKSNSGFDANSRIFENITGTPVFFVNDTEEVKSYALGNKRYLSDITGVYQQSITVQPFKYFFGIEVGDVIIPVNEATLWNVTFIQL